MPQKFTTASLAHLAEKLKTARSATGMSTREVAERIRRKCSLSHATIANYEKARTMPTLEVLAVLADAYERPVAWFLEAGPTLTGVRYRNLKSRVRVGDRQRFEAQSQLWLEAYVRLESLLRKPLRRHLQFGCTPDEPEEAVAARLRKKLRLRDDQPVPSVISVLEGSGVRTIELPTDLQIDGLAGRFGDEFVAVLNPTTKNDRCRMNAAHELAHVLYGDCHADGALDGREIEKRAYGLGSYLLLPQSQLEKAFDGRSFVRLVQYKERFGISIAAMVYRAEKTGIIDMDAAKWIWIQFAKRGWRKNEPGQVRPDRATRFEQLLDEAMATKKLRWRDVESVLGIREEDLRNRLDYAMNLQPEVEDEEGDDEDQIIRFRP